MAASRVNTKFVAILVGGLAAVTIGGGGVLYFFVANNATRLASLAEQAGKAGDFEKAERLYSKAVNKEQANPDLLRKWIASIEKVTPETENSYRVKYGEYYAATMALATRALQTDVEAHRAALELAHREIKDRIGDTTGNSEMVTSVDNALRNFEHASDNKHDVLRKYSGMALLRSYEAAANLKDAEVERARTDLEKATAADPSDGEAATGLARWHDRTAFKLQQANDLEGSKAEREKGRQILADFVKAHPDDVHGLLWDFLAFVTTEEQRIGAAPTEEARTAMAKQSMVPANEKLERFADVLNAMDPMKVELAMVDRLSAMEARFTEGGPKRAAALYDRLLAARPGDTRAMLSKASLLGEARREAEAVELLQKLVDVPQKAVSYEGVMQFGHRVRARYLQALYSVRSWETEKAATTLAAQKAAAERAAAVRKAAQDREQAVKAGGDPKKAEEAETLAKAAAEKAEAEAKAEAEKGEPQHAAAAKGWLEKAGSYRGKLAEMVDADSPELLFIDAHLSIANQDYGQAQKKLLEYNRKTRSTDTQALWMTAQCALMLGQDGTAETTLKQLLERERSNLRANLALARLYASRLKKPLDAMEPLDRALKIDRNNEEAQRLLQTVKAMAGGEESRGQLDAVSRALLQCDDLENTGKAAEAYKLLKDTYASSGDTRLVPPLVRRMVIRGEKAEAVKIMDEAIRKSPEDSRLLQAKVVLDTDDPLEQRIRLIEMVPGQREIDRLIAKVQVYRIFAAAYEKDSKKTALAKPTRALADKALDDAVKLDPKNASVLEMQFIRALSENDFTTAERLAEEARKIDIDTVEGATFRARLLTAKGRLKDAIRELQASRQNANFTPAAGRILAELMVQDNRVTDAVAVLQEALEKRKTDRDCLYALAVLHLRLDQGLQALEVLRAKQDLHPGDTDIQNLWLELEAGYGSKETALAQRRRQLDIDPGNVEAKLAVARLLIQKREFAGARKMIDELKSGAGKDPAVDVEASWYSEQGNLAGAKKVFDDHIAGLDAANRSPEVFLAKGRFMEKMDQVEEAVAAYKEAAKYQDPRTLDADRALSDLLFRQGAVKDAVALFRKIVDGKADTERRTYAKQLIDALLRMEDGPGAAAVIDGMGEAAQNDAQLVLQRAEAVRLSGDEKKALEIIDQAGVKFPDEPYVYYRRASLNLKYPELRKDVIADLLKAVEKRPSFWQARRDLARIKNQDGDRDGAIAQMRDAVKFNPGIDELRVQLVRDLLQLKRDQDASEVIESVIEKRRDDVGLLLNSGDLMREGGRNDAALNYYRRAYEISQQMAVVTRYIDLLHANNPPNVAEVDRVLVKLKDIQDSEPALLMARAKQYIFRKKEDLGIKDMIASLRLIRPDQPGMIMAWFGDIKRMLSDPKDVTKIIGLVDQEKLIPGWTTFFRAGTLLESEATQKEGTQLLEELVKTCTDMALLRQAYIALQARYYQTKDCENGLRVMRASLEKFPDDAFILNNYAYTLVRCGEDPAKAVPVAEKAVKSMLAMNRSSADILDTMGWVYVKAKMADKAALPLQAALAEAGNGPIRATVLMHIAELHVLRGDKKAATEAAEQAQRSLEQFPNAAKATGQLEHMTEVRKAISEMK